MKLYRDEGRSKSFFYYYGWTILVFLSAFFLVFFFVFRAMFYVKRTERIELFIAAHGLKDNDYGTRIEKEFKSRGLIEMNIYSYLEDDVAGVYNYFSANGENADFIIFSETNVKDLEEYVPANYFALSSFNEDIKKINEFDTYDYDGTAYGIKIFDGSDDAYNNKYKFKDFIEFTKEGVERESYYLLIDNGSPNFDKANKHALGYYVLDYFLNDMSI